MSQTKLKLLVVELDYHASLLDFLCPLLASRFELTLLCTRKIWDKLSLDASSFEAVYIKEKRESIAQFMRRAEPAVQRADVFYFNTLEKFTNFFARFEFAVPVILRVHNANATFRPRQSLQLTASNWPKAAWFALVKGVLTRHWQAKSRLLDKVDTIMLPTDGVREYCESQKLFKNTHKISPFCLPFSHLRPVAHILPKATERLVISVTGTVDVSRKDYDDLFDAIVLLKQQHAGRVELHFLGAVRGKPGQEVVTRFRSLEDERFQLFSGSGFVPQSHVDSVMSETHLLVAPIRLQSNFKMHREVYGSTKMSGVEIDVVNYQKIALVPKGYHVAKNLRSVLHNYDDAEDLCRQIIDFAINGANVGVEELSEYDKDVILDRFQRVVVELIEGDGSHPSQES